MLESSHSCGAAAIYGDGNTFYGTQIFVRNCGAANTAPRPFYDESVFNFELVNAFRYREGEADIQWSNELYELAVNWSYHMYHVQRLYHSDYNMAENVAYA